jgi:hypothetical protein
MERSVLTLLSLTSVIKRTTGMTENQLKNNRHIFSALMNERRPYCLLLSGGGGEASADEY